jgi:hypothetical protein
MRLLAEGALAGMALLGTTVALLGGASLRLLAFFFLVGLAVAAFARRLGLSGRRA